MEEKKVDIKKFIHDNYKLMIPIVFIFVLFIAFLVYYKVVVDNQYVIEKNLKVYQYFYGNKYEYVGKASFNRKDVIVDFEPQEIKINLDSTPIYYQKKDKVIFPKDMSVVMPTLSCAEYVAKGFSYITLKDDIYYLTTNRYNGRLNHYFLYDGMDLYFFIENVTLKVNGEEIVLSPFSYVIAKYSNYVSYYDKKSDTYRTITIDNSEVLVYNDYYKVEVATDTIDYQGTDVLLTSSLENLNTIDKKG